ncbi:MAG: hypothetical protein GXP15_06425 [Gammaproteobacteria bacterium]|nr:hypothetical protein [Gammaproteobacteria bacterium]
MKKTIALLLLAIIPLACPALADKLPSYYPDEGFSRTGLVDAVYTVKSRIVIDDIPYQVSKSAIVHSLTSERVSIARIRPGVRVAFKTGSDRSIQEFWLLPANYDRATRR